MRLHPESVIQLHDLYHRKEQDKYVIGNPETGEFLFITPADFQLLQLIHSGLTLEHAEELMKVEKEPVDVKAFLHELKQHGFIHKIDNKIVTPRHEPLHEFAFSCKWLGSRGAAFFYLLLSLFGVWTLIWRGNLPGFTIFFYQPYLSLTLLSTIILAWLLIAFRQVVKYGAAQYLGVPSRFGFSNNHHAFLPKVHIPNLSEQQQHHILGISLLSLTTAASVALILATYLQYPFNLFWSMAFTIAFIEILAECLLFLDTDLARFITINVNIHKLNRQTAISLKEDVKLLLFGKGQQKHPIVTKYAFFYLSSILLAIILLLAYILPGMLGFLVLAFSRLAPGNSLYVDAFIALAFFSIDLLLYGFSLLKHHHLNHNTFFLNTSLLSVTVASYIIAFLGVQWFGETNDLILSVILSYCLGIVLAIVFEEAVMLAHPFTKYHGLFEKILLPVLAAGIPISVAFSSVASSYVFAISLGVGMLTAVVFSHFSRTAQSV